MVSEQTNDLSFLARGNEPSHVHDRSLNRDPHAQDPAHQTLWAERHAVVVARFTATFLSLLKERSAREWVPEADLSILCALMPRQTKNCLAFDTGDAWWRSDLFLLVSARKHTHAIVADRVWCA